MAFCARTSRGTLTRDEITARVIAARMLAVTSMAVVAFGLARAAWPQLDRRLGSQLDLDRAAMGPGPVTAQGGVPCATSAR